jgi:hypothetical protein
MLPQLAGTVGGTSLAISDDPEQAGPRQGCPMPDTADSKPGGIRDVGGRV